MSQWLVRIGHREQANDGYYIRSHAGQMTYSNRVFGSESAAREYLNKKMEECADSSDDYSFKLFEEQPISFKQETLNIDKLPF